MFYVTGILTAVTSRRNPSPIIGNYILFKCGWDYKPRNNEIFLIFVNNLLIIPFGSSSSNPFYFFAITLFYCLQVTEIKCVFLTVLLRRHL